MAEWNPGRRLEIIDLRNQWKGGFYQSNGYLNRFWANVTESNGWHKKRVCCEASFRLKRCEASRSPFSDATLRGQNVECKGTNEVHTWRWGWISSYIHGKLVSVKYCCILRRVTEGRVGERASKSERMMRWYAISLADRGSSVHTVCISASHTGIAYYDFDENSEATIPDLSRSPNVVALRYVIHPSFEGISSWRN